MLPLDPWEMLVTFIISQNRNIPSIRRSVELLTELFGVGVKVANCVSLFGLHHVDAFPIDVWIRKILDREYPDGYPYEKYSPHNGIYQQYMFAYYRHKE